MVHFEIYMYNMLKLLLYFYAICKNKCIFLAFRCIFTMYFFFSN